MPADDAGSGFSAPNRSSGTLIGGLGALLITAHGPPLTQIQGVTALLLTVVFPSLLGLVLIGVGYSTAREQLVEPADAWRLAIWIVVGMVVFLLVGVWIVVLDLLLGEPVPFGYLLTVNAVTLGGVVGAVIGLYDAQGREYTRKLERRERNLEEKNQRLDEFVSIVSHDLRNPLNVAEGRLQLATDESGNEHLDHVERAHERMGALIDDLLELARHKRIHGGYRAGRAPRRRRECVAERRNRRRCSRRRGDRHRRRRRKSTPAATGEPVPERRRT